MAGDPHWSQVVLALHMDGANASTAFTDLKGHVVTPTGSAISTAQSKFGGASLYYDGVAAGNLTVTTSPDLALSNDFTIELWAKPATDCPTCYLISNATSFGANVWILEPTHPTNPGKWCFFMMGIAVTGGPLISTSNSLTDTWTHVAVTRQGNVFRMFVNGVLESIYTSVSALTANTTENLYLNGGVGRYKGYVDDLRITKGVARYTANFTPPALAFPSAPVMIAGTVKNSANAFAPRAVRVHRKSDGALSGAMTSHSTTGAFSVPALDASPHYALVHDSDADPYWPNVVLATHFDTDSVIDPYMSSVVLGLHMEGANASTAFQDVTGKTVTAVGNAQISTAQAKFGNSSALFGGAGDYLTLANSADFDFLAGDICFDFWVRPNSIGAAQQIYDSRVVGTARVGIAVQITAAGKVEFYASDSDTVAYEVDVIGATTLVINTWYHVACVRYGSDWRIYLNGVSDAFSTASFTVGTTAGVKYIGVAVGLVNAANFYLDDFRITKGVARYTANFTPPTVPFSSFKDLTGKDLLVNGVPTIDTGTRKYGGGALYCGGAAAFLTTSVPVITSIAFTIEFWVRVATATEQAFFSQYSNGDGRLTLILNASGKLEFFIGATAGNTLITAPATFPTAAFTHVAICRMSAGLITMFIGGVQVAQGANATALAATFNSIGAQVSTTNGVQRVSTSHIDDLRVTNGVARYQADFTPPERAFVGAIGASVANALIFDDLTPI